MQLQSVCHDTLRPISSSRNAVSFSLARATNRFPSRCGPNAVSNAIGSAKHRSRSHDAVIRVYDAAGNVIETHEHKGDFRPW
jgi:hypothetical protein